jgi:hypothetical protein
MRKICGVLEIKKVKWSVSKRLSFGCRMNTGKQRGFGNEKYAERVL